MTYHKADFPFEEIKDSAGNYFNSQSHLRKLGYAESQIWSVIEGDEEYREDGQRISTYVYGPSQHFVNKVGYVATKEHHDDETYYEETMEMEPYPEDFDDDPS